VGNFKQLACRVGAAVVLACVCSRALAIEVYQEYRKRIESAQNLTALKSDLFGESVSLYNGKTDFTVTDIDLPGNNSLPVRLQRRFSVELHLTGTAATFNSNIEGAGGWDVDVPYISGIFAPVSGWADTRCSVSMFPAVNGNFSVNEIWQGNTIHIPGGGDRTMLAREPGTPAPTDGIIRKWTTSQRDAIDCIPMKSGLTGEGFRVTTTQGVRYYFDIAATRYAGQIEKRVSPILPARTAGRTRVYLLVSKVEDRFGNTVEYQYDGEGHPTRIWSSDGREINAVYNGSYIASASTSGRTWTYEYTSVEDKIRLSRVVLPDNSNWRYSYSSALSPYFIPWDGNSTDDCAEQAPEVPADFTLTAEHPSGAVGTFVFANSRHYRSGIHMSQCVRRVGQADWGGTVYYELTMPNFFDVMSLYSKTISGPGIPQPITWGYSYGGGYQPLWGSRATGATYPCDSCPTEKPVVVTNPDGTMTQYRYGFLYALNEGRLLGSSVLDSAGVAVRTESTRYMTTAETAGQPFAPLYGIIYNGDDPSTAQVRPAMGTTVVQDGTTYSSTVNSFDGFGRPHSVTRSGPSYSSTDVTEYHDDQNRWVVEQVAKVTNTNTGKVVSETNYDGMSLPYQLWSFGKLQQTITYYADGTAATVKDGGDNTTTLASWKRGIPRSIGYADGTGQSAVVDDRGWIESITDENGSKTGYHYDDMGRITAITYPENDGVAWNSTIQAFEQMSGSEYGIAAGHWRQTIATGDARKEVHFDALWRPVLSREYGYGQEAQTERFQRLAYDHDGRTTFASYAGSSASLSTGTWTAYDALGRVSSTSADSELGLLTTLIRYASGNRASVTDPRGQNTTTTFFALDQPVSDQAVHIEHPEGAYTDIERDVFAKPISIARHNSDNTEKVVRSYAYDDNELLCKVLEPETGATVTDYDAAGNVAWTAAGLALPERRCGFDRDAARNSGRRVDRAYDARNRLRTLTFPDSDGNQSWLYTNDGKPANVTTWNDKGASQVINEYSYYKRGLLREERVQQTGEGVWTLGYQYDPNGALSAQVYPSGLLVAYSPNALGQATRAGSYATGVAYWPSGGMRTFAYGNGIVHSMMQNDRQLPSHVVDGEVLDDTYSYDANANVTQITDAVTPSYSRSMEYDGLNRLTKARSTAFGGTDGTYNYTYDTLDNLRSVRLAGKRDHSYWYDPSNNRLQNVRNQSGGTIGAIFYDAQGNVSNKSMTGGYNQDFTFDYGNRLRVANDKEAYRYDAHGRRVKATAPGDAAIVSFYDQGGALRRQDNRREGKNYEYISLNGSLVARVTTVVAPVAPLLTVSPGFSATGAYTATWTSVDLAARYELGQENGTSSPTIVYSGSGTNKAFSGMAPGTYSYKVRACRDASEEHCSVWGAPAGVAVKFPPQGSPAPMNPSEAPGGDYVVTWGQADGADRYDLKESANGGAWVLVPHADPRSISFIDKPAGTYRYQVTACNETCAEPATGATATRVYYKPTGVPTINPVPSPAKWGTYTLDWTAIGDATSYLLEESRDWVSWKQFTPSINAQAFTNKPTGYYIYRVAACNGDGCNPSYSLPIVVFAQQPPGAVPLYVPGSSTSGDYTVSWGSHPDATYYLFDENAGSGWVRLSGENRTSYPFSNKPTGTYWYRVTPCNETDCKYPGTETTPIIVTRPPAQPVIASNDQFRITDSRGRVKVACSVRWTGVAHVDRYELWSYSNGNYYQKQYEGLATSVSTTYNDNSSQYCAPAHVVRACNVAGCTESVPAVQSVYNESGS
jgi:YD repeat-containing protein